MALDSIPVQKPGTKESRAMSFLLSTPHGYYFRIVVPIDLRQAIGRREIKKSLGSFDLKFAKLVAGTYATRCHLLFRTLREGSSSMSNKKIDINDTTFGIGKVEFYEDGSVKSVENIQADPDKAEQEKDLMSAFFNAAVGSSSIKTINPAKVEEPPKAKPLLLSELIEKYCLRKQGSNKWKPKSEDEYRASFKLLLTVLGDVDVSTIDDDMATKYRETVKKLPPNMNKSPLYRGLSIQQVLKKNPKKVLSIQSVNKHCQRASSLFKWAQAKGFIDLNFFDDLSIDKTKRDFEERSSYSTQDLDKLFSSQIFTANKMLHSHYYWVPLIGLYSGMRLDEICQLHLNDICEEDSIWFFDVNEDGDKKLKNQSSKRYVPIHSRLIDLGLIDHVQKLKKKGETRLFPELKKARDGHSQAASKWFGRYRSTVGVESSDKRKLDFHSFRHTVANSLKQDLVVVGLAAAVLGHAQKGITYGRYSNTYSLTHLKDTVEKLSFLHKVPVAKYSR